MVRTLLLNFATCDDQFFTSVPGPKKIAEKLGLETVRTLIEDCLAKEAEQNIAAW